MMKDWDPDSYRQVNTLQQLVAEHALADLVLEGDERVFDVGCGDGNVTCGCLTIGTSSKHFLQALPAGTGLGAAGRRHDPDRTRPLAVAHR